MLIVLAARQFDEELASYLEVDEKAYKAARLELQKELAALSTNSQLIVAEKKRTHYSTLPARAGDRCRNTTRRNVRT